MKLIEKIETMVAKWLKPLPHMPVKFNKWLSGNIWWIALIGVILSAIATLFLIGGLITIISLLGAATSFYGYYYAASAYTGWSVLASVISLLFIVVVIILMAMAISPLKVTKKKGWNLLFAVALLQVLSTILGAILTFSMLGFISSLIGGAIAIAISAYLLFEIRSYFGAGVKTEAAPAAVAAPAPTSETK